MNKLYQYILKPSQKFILEHICWGSMHWNVETSQWLSPSFCCCWFGEFLKKIEKPSLAEKERWNWEWETEKESWNWERESETEKDKWNRETEF